MRQNGAVQLLERVPSNDLSSSADGEAKAEGHQHAAGHPPRGGLPGGAPAEPGLQGTGKDGDQTE